MNDPANPTPRQVDTYDRQTAAARQAVDQIVRHAHESLATGITGHQLFAAAGLRACELIAELVTDRHAGDENAATSTAIALATDAALRLAAAKALTAATDAAPAYTPMAQTRAEADPDTDYGIDYPPHVRWDLGDQARISVGRDGEHGPWIVYLGLNPGQPDIYCETSIGQLRDWATQIITLTEGNGR
jgi:hypothetical protein